MCVYSTSKATNSNKQYGAIVPTCMALDELLFFENYVELATIFSASRIFKCFTGFPWSEIFVSIC